MASVHVALEAMRRPPSPDGMGTGTALAVLVHVGLIAALAYGVAWRRHEVTTVSAELWAAVPQIAAPMAAEAPPPPPAPPQTKPVTAPPPPKAEQQPSRDADIALEKARKKAQAEREEAQLQAEKKKADEKKAKDKREALAKAEKAEKAEKAAKDEAKRLADKKETDAKARADAAKEAARDAKLDKAQAERLAKMRQENLQRMSRELGNNPAVGNATTPSAGTAAQSAAPSAGYEGRIRARILPNIVFTGRINGPSVAEVEVRVAPDGTILGSRLLRASGLAEWDQAVLRAIERTEVLPRDIDGRVPPLMVLSFDPTKR